MTDVTLGSDAFFPFSDNIERAHKSGVKYIAQPGGSVRDDAVIETCNKYGMVQWHLLESDCSITKVLVWGRAGHYMFLSAVSEPKKN